MTSLRFWFGMLSIALAACQKSEAVVEQAGFRWGRTYWPDQVVVLDQETAPEVATTLVLDETVEVLLDSLSCSCAGLRFSNSDSSREVRLSSPGGRVELTGVESPWRVCLRWNQQRVGDFDVLAAGRLRFGSGSERPWVLEADGIATRVRDAMHGLRFDLPAAGPDSVSLFERAVPGIASGSMAARAMVARSEGVAVHIWWADPVDPGIGVLCGMVEVGRNATTGRHVLQIALGSDEAVRPVGDSTLEVSIVVRPVAR